jgi:hypothetical protein
MATIRFAKSSISNNLIKYQNAAGGIIKATGGTIYKDDTYVYHKFTGDGTFKALQNLTADILCIAGGGAGGAHGLNDKGGGGGGAGGVVYKTGQLLGTNSSYSVTIGAGGTATTGTANDITIAGGNGSRSEFGSASDANGFPVHLYAFGGGGGAGGYAGNDLWHSGKFGGSGGGATNGGYAGSAYGLKEYSAVQNSVGGGNTTNTTQGYRGGEAPSGSDSGAGGGGYSAVGVTVSGGNPGTAGGAGGSTWSSWGLATSSGQNVSGTYYFAGGGGGGTYSGSGSGAGGNGGGGAGGAVNSNGVAGTANTGGGGGGTGGGPNAARSGHNGGSGIVIVRYAI